MNCIWEGEGGSIKDNCLIQPDSTMGSFIKIGIVKEKNQKRDDRFGIGLVDLELTFIYPHIDTD